MDIATAVAKAKEFVITLFNDEPMSRVGLEEIERDEMQNLWRITIGFDRATTSNSIAAVSALMSGKNTVRCYRVVTLTDDGRMLSVKRRDATGE